MELEEQHQHHPQDRNGNGKFNLALCEIHNPRVHGNGKANRLRDTHYWVYKKYVSFHSLKKEKDNDEEESDDDEEDEEEEQEEEEESIFKTIERYKKHIRDNIVPRKALCVHPFIRNFKNIISNDTTYIQPQIVECFYTADQTCLAILKTYWIRIVQRTWKRVFQERKRILSMRCHPHALHYREIHRSWPAHCRRLPSIKGMIKMFS